MLRLLFFIYSLESLGGDDVPTTSARLEGAFVCRAVTVHCVRVFILKSRCGSVDDFNLKM